MTACLAFALPCLICTIVHSSMRKSAKRSTHSSEEEPSTARSSTAQNRGSAELRHEEGHRDESIPNRCRCKKTSYNHITSSLMRSSKVPASEEERDIKKKHRILKIRECYKESRQLDALHFYTVPEGRDG